MDVDPWGSHHGYSSLFSYEVWDILIYTNDTIVYLHVNICFCTDTKISFVGSKRLKFWIETCTYSTAPFLFIGRINKHCMDDYHHQHHGAGSNWTWSDAKMFMSFPIKRQLQTFIWTHKSFCKCLCCNDHATTTDINKTDSRHINRHQEGWQSFSHSLSNIFHIDVTFKAT